MAKYIPGYAPQRVQLDGTNPWATHGAWIPNTGKRGFFGGTWGAGALPSPVQLDIGSFVDARQENRPQWVDTRGIQAYEKDNMSFPCCGTAGIWPLPKTIAGVWMANTGKGPWLAGAQGNTAGCGCGCNGAPGGCGMAGAGSTPQQVEKLDAKTWADTFDYLRTQTKLPPKAVCSIMAWLGGASPNPQVADAWRSLKEMGWNPIVLLNPFAHIADAAGSVYYMLKTGRFSRIDSIEDVCGDDAMPLEQAIKMAASPAYGGSKQLAAKLVKLGEGHHEALLEQSVAQVQEETKEVVYQVAAVPLKALGAATEAAIQGLKRAAGISNVGLGLAVAAGLLAYFIYRKAT